MEKQNNFISVLLALFVAWWGAYYTTLVLIDNDPHCKAILTVFIRGMLTNAFQAETALTVNHIRLGVGTIRATSVHLQNPHGAWAWDMGQLGLTFSLSDIIATKSLPVAAKIHHGTVQSAVNEQGVALAPTIAHLLASTTSGQFITVYHITITNTHLNLTHDQGTLKTSFAADLPLSGSYRTSRIWWYRGELYYRDTCVSRNNAGTYSFHHHKRTAHITTTTTVIPTSTTSYPLQGTFTKHADIWRGSLTSPAGIQLEGILNNRNDTLEITGAVPGAVISACCAASSSTACTGTLTFTGTAQASAILATARIIGELNDGTIAGTKLPPTKLEINNLTSPALRLQCGDNLLDATITHSASAYGIDVCLPSPVHLTSGYALNETSSCRLFIKPTGVYTGLFTLAYSHPDKGAHRIEGSLAGDHTSLKVQGSWGTYTFALGGLLQPQPQLTHVELAEHKKSLLKLTHKDNLLQGSGDIRLLTRFIGPLSLGEGTCTFAGTVTARALDGICTVTDAALRIPGLYNIVEQASCSAHIDWHKQKFELSNLHLAFHQGILRSSLLQGTWKGMQLSSLSIPSLAENCLISWQKGLFGLVSGAGMISYDGTQYTVQGRIAIEQAHMRNNILSFDFGVPAFSEIPVLGKAGSFTSTPQRDTTSSAQQATPLLLDLHIATRKPISVKSTFLDTNVHATATINGPSTKPTLAGTITMAEGTILFPYKPLFIRHGSATIRPSVTPSSQSTVFDKVLDYGATTYEPHISLLAENTIKGYRVRMQVQGSLKDPELTFSSTPHLSQEQIIALLFGGSEDGSIYVAMSSYIMHSLQTLLFGADEQSSTVLQSLKNLFKPLGSVRFVPSFTDQSSRGGIRGSLALEVNDRLRGIIKQNFELPQDVLLEVEYDLSDEARIRALKDERGDLGAEIEASWKF